MVVLPAVRLQPHSRHACATLAGHFLVYSAVMQVILDEIRNERKCRTVGQILLDTNVVIIIKDLFIKNYGKNLEKLLSNNIRPADFAYCL